MYVITESNNNIFTNYEFAIINCDAMNMNKCNTHKIPILGIAALNYQYYYHKLINSNTIGCSYTLSEHKDAATIIANFISNLNTY